MMKVVGIVGAGNLAVFLLSIVAQAQQQTSSGEEVLLRLKFAEKEAWQEVYKVKLVVSPKSANSGLEGDMSMETEMEASVSVQSMDNEGTAKEEFSYKRLKSKVTMGQKSYEFDSEKDAKDEKPCGDCLACKAGRQDQCLRVQYVRILKAKVNASIDARGNFKFEGAGGLLGPGQGNFDFSSIGLMGYSLPKEKVKVVSEWSEERDLDIPNFPSKAKVKTTSKLEKVESVEGQKCAVIKVKIDISASGEVQRGKAHITMKMSGGGEFTQLLGLEQGKMLQVRGEKPLVITINAATKVDEQTQDVSVEMSVSSSMERKK